MLRSFFGQILLSVALKALPNEVFGLSTAAILKNLPGILAWLKQGNDMVKALKDKGVDEEDAAEATMDVLAGKRSPTPLERDAWMDIANQPSGH